MRFSLAAFAFAFLGQTLANTLTVRKTTIGASLPVVALGPPSADHSVTLAQSTVHTNAVSPRPDEIDIVLLVCEELGCQLCDLIDLMGLNANTCFSTPHSFVSTAVVQPNAPTLPFNTTVGTTQCQQLLALPATNTCFNLQGAATFNSFALLVNSIPGSSKLQYSSANSSSVRFGISGYISHPFRFERLRLAHYVLAYVVHLELHHVVLPDDYCPVEGPGVRKDTRDKGSVKRNLCVPSPVQHGCQLLSEVRDLAARWNGEGTLHPPADVDEVVQYAEAPDNITEIHISIEIKKGKHIPYHGADAGRACWDANTPHLNLRSGMDKGPLVGKGVYHHGDINNDIDASERVLQFLGAVCDITNRISTPVARRASMAAWPEICGELVLRYSTTI
ncbi:hypothetical protein BC628DRAFT_1340191 [Trametes gibbosa]|nr:hypothetical protein BC628DRAFT_1340191 [Trametes gibbosa]